MKLSQEPMKILFITRKFPPAIGGMQKMNYNLFMRLKDKARVDVAAGGFSTISLPFFLIRCWLNYIFLRLLRRKKYDVILFGDALLIILARFFKFLGSVRTVCIAHGLDITFYPALYQKVLRWGLRSCDTVICVSDYTKSECLRRGVDSMRLRVIPNGVDKAMIMPKISARQELKKNGIALPEGSTVLLTVGRLVARKGVVEFIDTVMPGLCSWDKGIVYIVVGDGPLRQDVESAIERNRLNGYVYLAGGVSEENMPFFYSAADVFVMPNRKIPNDIEGFGIVALEACSYGIPVIAADVDGLREVVKDGINGYLVPFDRPELYFERLKFLLQERQKLAALSLGAREFSSRFYWDNIADRYMEALR